MPATAATCDFWAQLIVHSSHHRDKTQLQTQALVHSLIITKHHCVVTVESVYVFLEMEGFIKIKTAVSLCVWEVVSVSTVWTP